MPDLNIVWYVIGLLSLWPVGMDAHMYRIVRYGWVMPIISIILWLGAVALLVAKLLPVWACALIAGALYFVSWPITFGIMRVFMGQDHFRVWQEVILTEDALLKFFGACRPHLGIEKVQTLVTKTASLMVIFRSTNPFYRKFIQSSEEMVGMARQLAGDLYDSSLDESPKTPLKIVQAAFTEAVRRWQRPLERR
jgi:hypothetical protein